MAMVMESNNIERLRQEKTQFVAAMHEQGLKEGKVWAETAREQDRLEVIAFEPPRNLGMLLDFSGWNEEKGVMSLILDDLLERHPEFGPDEWGYLPDEADRYITGFLKGVHEFADPSSVCHRQGQKDGAKWAENARYPELLEVFKFEPPRNLDMLLDFSSQDEEYGVMSLVLNDFLVENPDYGADAWGYLPDEVDWYVTGFLEAVDSFAKQAKIL